MKKLDNILEIVRQDLEDNIPALLSAQGLTNFPEYQIGQPRDESITTCSVMYAPELPITITDERLPILVYLQLCRIDYLSSLKYTDVVKRYLKNYDLQRIGVSILNDISIDIIPIDRNMNTDIYIIATYSEPLDSCDRDEEENES